MLLAVRRIPSTRWIVGVQVTQREAYAPIVDARARIAGIALGLGVGIGGIAMGYLAVGGLAVGVYAIGGLGIGVHTLQNDPRILDTVRKLFRR